MYKMPTSVICKSIFYGLQTHFKMYSGNNICIINDIENFLITPEGAMYVVMWALGFSFMQFELLAHQQQEKKSAHVKS